MSISQTETKEVRFINFLFSPHFDKGDNKATFHLVCINNDNEILITSSISNIRRDGNSVNVETQNSMYHFIIPDKACIVTDPYLNVTALENALNDPNFSSRKFFEKYVSNAIPTPNG